MKIFEKTVNSRRGQSMEDKIREEIHFYGRVQAVGFRYKMYHLAEKYGVTGWVQNEYDGSVLAQAQGTQAQIDIVLQALSSDRYIVIDELRRRRIPLEEEERRFGIRH